MIAAFVLATALVQTSQPARPPDGTYRYALIDAGKTAFTSSVVVKTDGATFDVSEAVKLPNGDLATTATTYDSATLLPLRYELHQGTVSVHGTITSGSVKFALTNGSKSLKPFSYSVLPETKHMLVYDGLNAFRVILPYIMAAHPGEPMTVGYVDAIHTERAYASTISPQHGGPPGDVVSAVNLDKEQLIVWRNPKTGAIDLERVVQGGAEMKLVHYSSAR